jgi:hypothetical protein
MKARLEDKKKAIELRKKGLSYKEIQAQIDVSKGLLSLWLKFLPLTPEEEHFLSQRMIDRRHKGRLGTMLSNRNRRVAREIQAFEDAKNIFNKNSNDWIFLMGIALYWAEGSKRTGCFQFINSDPDMTLFMYRWIQKYLGIEKSLIRCRLFTHKIEGHENHGIFWARNLEVEPSFFKKTIFKPTALAVKKNPDYKGCLRLEVGGIYELRLMKAWQKLLIQYYTKVVK